MDWNLAAHIHPVPLRDVFCIRHPFRPVLVPLAARRFSPTST